MIFPRPFTNCSLCTRKFVICPFVYEEANGRYPFANGINDFAHLWLRVSTVYTGDSSPPFHATDVRASNALQFFSVLLP
jgi:hypothetical protein